MKYYDLKLICWLALLPIAFLSADEWEVDEAQHCLRFALTEQLGVSRTAEPVVIAGAMLLEKLPGETPSVTHLRLFGPDGELPLQVDRRTEDGAWAEKPAGPLVPTDELAFLAHVPAGESVEYRLYSGAPRPAFTTALAVQEHDVAFYTRHGWDITMHDDRVDLRLNAADGQTTPRGQALDRRGRREGSITGLAIDGQAFARVQLPYTNFQQDHDRAWDGRRVVATGPVRAIVEARLELDGQYRHRDGEWAVTWNDDATITGSLQRSFILWADTGIVTIEDHFRPRQTGDNFTMNYQFVLAPPTTPDYSWLYTRELLADGPGYLLQQHQGRRERTSLRLNDEQRAAGWLGVRDSVTGLGVAVGFEPERAYQAISSLLVPWAAPRFEPPPEMTSHLFVGTYHAAVRRGETGRHRFRLWLLNAEDKISPAIRRRAEYDYPLAATIRWSSVRRPGDPVPELDPGTDTEVTVTALDAELESLREHLERYRHHVQRLTREQLATLIKEHEALQQVSETTPPANRYRLDEAARLLSEIHSLRQSFDLRRLELVAAQPDAGRLGFTAFVADSLEKIRPHGAPPNPQPLAVKLESARRESESFQIVLVSGRQPVRDLRIEVSDLSGPDGAVLSAEHIRRYRVGWLPRLRDGRPDLDDRWPDPLIPLPGCPGYPSAEDMLFESELEALGTLTPHENQPFWFSIRVPENAVAGDYSGDIRFQVGDHMLTVPVRLHVYDFTLPEQPSVIGDIWFSNGLSFMRYYGRDVTVEEFAPMVEWLREYRLNTQLSWLTLTRLVEIKKDQDGLYHFDFSTLDPWLEVALPGNRWFNANLGCGIGWTGHFGGVFGRRTPILDEASGEISQFPPQPISAEDMVKHPLWSHFWTAFTAHLRERGWLEQCYVENIDEPPYGPGRVDLPRNVFLRQFHTAMREAAPGLRLFNYGMSPSPRYHAWAVEYVDAWGPSISSVDFSLPELRAQQEMGQPFVTYVCGGIRRTLEHHTPDVYVDQPAIDLRILPWMVWHYGAEGILYYSGNSWVSDNAREDVPNEARQRWPARPWHLHAGAGFGNGWFTYPAPKGIAVWPSIRLENIRDGLEDYEYLHLLSTLSPEPVLVDDMIESALIWERDPATLRARRTAIAEAILNAKEID